MKHYKQTSFTFLLVYAYNHCIRLSNQDSGLGKKRTEKKLCFSGNRCHTLKGHTLYDHVSHYDQGILYLKLRVQICWLFKYKSMIKKNNFYLYSFLYFFYI